MTSPHVDLGNSFQDVGQGANTFAAGLVATRQRQQQLALQEALAKSKIAMDAATTQHIGAQTDQLIPAQAGEANAQTAHLGAETNTLIPAQANHLNAEATNESPVDDASWEEFTKDKPNLRNTPIQLRQSISHAWAQGALGYHPEHYQSVGLSPSGTAVVLDSRTGQLTTTNTQMQQKGIGGAMQEKIRLGAANAANALRNAERLLSEDPNADVKPIMTSIANGAEHIPVIGSALSGLMEPAGTGAMTPHQQQFETSMSQFAHNAVGLLPGSRQSLTLFNDLRSAYRPKANESAEGRAFKQAQRHKLIAKFEAIARGEQMDLSDDFGPEFGALGQGDPSLAPTTSIPGQSSPQAQNPYGYRK